MGAHPVGPGRKGSGAHERNASPAPQAFRSTPPRPFESRPQRGSEPASQERGDGLRGPEEKGPGAADRRQRRRRTAAGAPAATITPAAQRRRRGPPPLAPGAWARVEAFAARAAGAERVHEGAERSRRRRRGGRPRPSSAGRAPFGLELPPPPGRPEGPRRRINPLTESGGAEPARTVGAVDRVEPGLRSLGRPLRRPRAGPRVSLSP